jgi:hypothetical protein
MTDLHFDVKYMDWHFERNKWSIKLTIFIGDNTKEAFKEADVHNGYEHIFIPLTLTRCLVVEDGGLIQINLPTYKLGMDNIEYQDIWLSGKEFHLMSMSTYFEQRKKEKLAESRDIEVKE